MQYRLEYPHLNLKLSPEREFFYFTATLDGLERSKKYFHDVTCISGETHYLAPCLTFCYRHHIFFRIPLYTCILAGIMTICCPLRNYFHCKSWFWSQIRNRFLLSFSSSSGGGAPQVGNENGCRTYVLSGSVDEKWRTFVIPEELRAQERWIGIVSGTKSEMFWSYFHEILEIEITVVEPDPTMENLDLPPPEFRTEPLLTQTATL